MRRRVATNERLVTRYGSNVFSVFRIGPARNLYSLSIDHHFCAKDSDRGEILTRGTILYPRRDEATGELRHHIYENGIFDAIRGRAQTMLGYGVREGVRGERQKIEAARGTLRDVWALLAAYGNLEVGERRRVKDAMRRTVMRIGPVRNPAKRDARTLVSRGRLVRDSLGRVNPSATRVRLINADDRLGLRLEEITAITPAVGYYEIVLLNELARIYGIFDEVWRVLTVLVGSKGTLATRKTFEPRLVRAIIAQLYRSIFELDTIQVAPFIGNWHNVGVLMLNAVKYLKDGDYGVACRRLWSARNLLAYMFALRELERIRFRLICVIAAGRTSSVDRLRLTNEFSSFLARACKKLDLGPSEELYEQLDEASKIITRDEFDLDKVKDCLKRVSRTLANAS